MNINTTNEVKVKSGWPIKKLQEEKSKTKPSLQQLPSHRQEVTA